MAIIHITNPADLKAGDRVILAPYGVPLFQNKPQILEEKEGLVGFTYGEEEEDSFFPIFTSIGELVEPLVLVDATRDVYKLEPEETIGEELFETDYDFRKEVTPVVLRHPEYGDYVGYVTDEHGYPTIRVGETGIGGFHYWKVTGYKIYQKIK